VPTIKGVPWWGAVLIGVGATTLGAFIDTVILDDSSSALGRAFKICYILGCLLAALAVRQRALFTAAAQPPLIAFIVGVGTLYTLNSDSAEGMKSIVLKVVLPIATSFPWILLAFLLTLVVVGARWFLARPKGQALFGKAARTRTGSGGSNSTKTTSTKAAAGAQKAAGTTAAAKKSAPKKSASRPSATTRPATTKTAATKTGTSKTAAPAKKAARPPQARPDAATNAPQPARRAAPRPSSPSAPPAATPRSAPAQKRPAPASATRQAPARKSAETPRRAAPQTIPARDPKAPRRTAGQMRDNGAIEDLTAGADDR